MKMSDLFGTKEKKEKKRKEKEETIVRIPQIILRYQVYSVNALVNNVGDDLKERNHGAISPHFQSHAICSTCGLFGRRNHQP